MINLCVGDVAGCVASVTILSWVVHTQGQYRWLLVLHYHSSFPSSFYKHLRDKSTQWEIAGLPERGGDAQ